MEESDRTNSTPIQTNSDALALIEYYYEQGRSLGTVHADTLDVVYKSLVIPYKRKFSPTYTNHIRRTQNVVSKFRQIFKEAIDDLTKLEAELVEEVKHKFPEMDEALPFVPFSDTSSTSSWGSSNETKKSEGSDCKYLNEPNETVKEEPKQNEDLVDHSLSEQQDNNFIGFQSSMEFRHHLKGFFEGFVERGCAQEQMPEPNTMQSFGENETDEKVETGRCEVYEGSDAKRTEALSPNLEIHEVETVKIEDSSNSSCELNDDVIMSYIYINEDEDTFQTSEESEISKSIGIESHCRNEGTDQNIGDTLEFPKTMVLHDAKKEKLETTYKIDGGPCDIDETELVERPLDSDRIIHLKMTVQNELTWEDEDNSADGHDELSIPCLTGAERQSLNNTSQKSPGKLRDEKENLERRIALSLTSDEDVIDTKDTIRNTSPNQRLVIPNSSATINQDPKLLENNSIVDLDHLDPEIEKVLKYDGFIKLSQDVEPLDPDIHNTDEDQYNADTEYDSCDELDKLNRQLTNFQPLLGDANSPDISLGPRPTKSITRKTTRRPLRIESDAEDGLLSSDAADEGTSAFKNKESMAIDELPGIIRKLSNPFDGSSGTDDLDEFYSNGEISNVEKITQKGSLSSKHKTYRTPRLPSSSEDSEAEARRRVLFDADIDDINDEDGRDIISEPVMIDKFEDIHSSQATMKMEVETDKNDEFECDSDILSVHSNCSTDFKKAFTKTKKGKRKSHEVSSSDESLLSGNGNESKRERKKPRIIQIGRDEEHEPEETIPGRARNLHGNVNSSSKSNGIQETEAVPIPAFLKRKNIRKIMSRMDLKESTRMAEKEEEDRKKRVALKQKLLSSLFEAPDGKSKVEQTRLVLDIDSKTQQPIIAVDETIVCQLKPHQVEGVKFLYNSCFESVEMIKKKKGGGCILAHCMGLGKTLQAVGFSHTVLTNSNITGIKTVLIVCPLTTVKNWIKEYKQWLDDAENPISLHPLCDSNTTIRQRIMALKSWQKNGGVGIMNYERFRVLVKETLNEDEEKKNKKYTASQRETIRSVLLDPGPDMVICDEGHLLKNHESQISVALSMVKTLRRVVLTGTPLQNNLVEYHTMMNFVKPNLLGSREEFDNRFANPIKNGQCKDSDAIDVQIMKRRSHVLHRKLEGCVQRLDYNVLVPFLPPKHEYCILIKLSEKQKELYRHYLATWCADMAKRGKYLLQNYAALVKIIAHPVVLTMKKQLLDSDSDEPIEDEEQAEATLHSKVKRRKPRKPRSITLKRTVKTSLLDMGKEWWSEIFQNTEDMYDVNLSGKILILQEILKNCYTIGDRLLVFSQYLTTLNIIEQFLEQWDDEAQKTIIPLRSTRSADPSSKGVGGSNRWRAGSEFFRIDGSTSTDDRQKFCEAFNMKGSNTAKLFLISTKAGGLGINLYGANRVVIFDASWNPSNDMQSIFRVFRFGQEKPSYIYRFVGQATMEEKIYNRQVVKLSLSSRVVDEHQIERHFKFDDINELYTYNPEDKVDRPVPALPKDRMLADLLISHKDWIESYFEHDSLLVNKEDEGLTEEERRLAWEEYKRDNAKREAPSYAEMFQSSMQIKSMLLRMDPLAPSAKIEHITNKILTKINELQQRKLSDDQEEYANADDEKELQDFITNSWNSWTDSTTKSAESHTGTDKENTVPTATAEPEPSNSDVDPNSTLNLQNLMRECVKKAFNF